MKKIDVFNWILVVIAIIGGVYQSYFTILNGNLYGTLIRLGIIPVMLFPYIIKYVFKKDVSNLWISIYILFIFFAHFLGSIMNFYYTIPNYDKLMHFLSGVLSSLFAIIILVRLNKADDNKLFFDIIFILALTMLVASFWEFYEFTFDKLFNKDAQLVKLTGVGDTMKDMIAAFIGSILVIIMYSYEVINKQQIVFKKIIKHMENSRIK